MAAKRTKIRVYLSLIAGISTLLFAFLVWQSQPGYKIVPGYGVIEKAYRNQQSGLMVEVTGQVVRILLDDTDDLQHQRFVIRLQNGQALLVIHNIVSGDPVPVSINQEVTVRGQYSWTEPGGMINWTRRDYSIERRHGWIEHQGRKYD